MQVDNLYTGYSWGAGYGQWTNPIITIPIDTESFTDAYYLGWVRYENIPNIWKTSVYYFDGTAGMLSFNDISVRQNVSIGFAGKDTRGTSVSNGRNFRYLANTGYSGYTNRWGNTWSQYDESPSDGYGTRLLNKWFPLSTSYKNLSFRLYCLYSWGNLYNGDWCETRTMSIANFISFMNGDISLTFTFQSGISYTLTGTDFTDGYYLDETNNRRIIITRYTFYTNQFYIPDIDQESQQFAGVFGQSDYFYNDEKIECITSGTDLQKMGFSNQYAEMFAFRSFANIGSSNTLCADKTSGVNSSMLVPQGTPFGGLITGKISQTEMNNLTSYGQYIEMENNNYLIYGIETGGTNFKIVHGYTLSEIYKHAALFRWTPNAKQYGYEDGVVYFPKIDLETNEFLCELITGTKAEVEPQLPLWFKRNDPTLSEYADEQKPEYNPEPGDEDEESGTRIPNQFRYFTGANNFISQYAMKASQIQTFGQMLWNSWADSTTFVDAVNNFWIALNIENFTGSFDISSVMDFIVSLKVFPFNITHFETSIFTLTDTLRIGRGTFPFLFPSEVGNIIKVLSNIVYVDCGLIHDPTTGQYGIPRKFNDFRDYTNVSITCFCPYCGTVELNPGDVVGRQLSCKYAVDLQTGECLCLITVADSTGDLYNVAAISGNMGANIPVSATNSGLIESRRLSDAGNALGLFGGMFTENMSMGSNTFARAKDSQSSIGAIASATSQAAGNLFKDIKQTSNFAANMLSRGAIGCPIMQGGSGFAAFSQADTPYVQIRYGIYSEPANYSHSVGRISTKSDVLSSYKDSGLVICENVDVSGFTCHEDERAEIKALLESGVYL